MFHMTRATASTCGVCRFWSVAVCFQEVPRVEAAGYSRSNPQQRILQSTSAISIGSRRRNPQKPYSTRAGVTCRSVNPMPKAACSSEGQ